MSDTEQLKRRQQEQAGIDPDKAKKIVSGVESYAQSNPVSKAWSAVKSALGISTAPAKAFKRDEDEE